MAGVCGIIIYRVVSPGSGDDSGANTGSTAWNSQVYSANQNARRAHRIRTRARRGEHACRMPVAHHTFAPSRPLLPSAVAQVTPRRRQRRRRTRAGARGLLARCAAATALGRGAAGGARQGRACATRWGVRRRWLAALEHAPAGQSTLSLPTVNGRPSSERGEWRCRPRSSKIGAVDCVWMLTRGGGGVLRACGHAIRLGTATRCFVTSKAVFTPSRLPRGYVGITLEVTRHIFFKIIGSLSGGRRAP